MTELASIRERIVDLVEDPADVAFVARMLRSFADRAPGLAEALTAAVEAGDAEAVAARAHALKGAAGNAGATGLAAACAELERRAGAGDLAGVRGGAAEVREALIRTDAAITHALAELFTS
ncbi:Hpt domain-containing protein [Spirilliplanes yamanashiensis]|uniref:HPt domain-containing protein n=1 Tax=Spirilliplanes yamanashiensis TaxID=42233 RepID=A0A8J3Y5D3_9ACTN|nr:Hpt domain-containing protein [Spirilliplanes yamanashiensis]MDP9819342.1 HPt (histidine-containing phosphotransfer) domain-containing protein [Spirilliplanes yamanashiensis]GIJ01835.1 hypothetical protein Sya03_11870 [Spirilliplanes yamanashiensis]